MLIIVGVQITFQLLFLVRDSDNQDFNDQYNVKFEFISATYYDIFYS